MGEMKVREGLGHVLTVSSEKVAGKYELEDKIGDRTVYVNQATQAQLQTARDSGASLTLMDTGASDSGAALAGGNGAGNAYIRSLVRSLLGVVLVDTEGR